MDKTYDHKQKEPQIYEMWAKNNYFSPEGALSARKKAGLPVKEETFCVLMPPPNANAPLHCGHATYSIQDLYTRIRRMQGYKSLYLPGTDHAGFETQVVYERHLKKSGKSRFDFDRQTFYNDVYKFVLENSDVAINQLKKLGMSADWDRNVFMLSDFVTDTVYNTFIKMHNEGLIYRDNYIVNYSPAHGTTFSNLETLHKEDTAPMCYVKYPFEDGNGNIVIATVRPETIYADVAIAVNPKDQRYQKYVGKLVINPLNGVKIPIIEDSYVDVEFGTGALKITPGHDFNDFEIGKKHGLVIESVIDLDGRMTQKAGEVSGMKVMEARKKVIEILKTGNFLEKIDENYKYNLLVDYKDGKPIEPLLIPNWFIKMRGLADNVIKSVEANKVKFNKPLWKKEIIRWLREIKDWPISRQTVFGIRIPVWYSISKNKDLRVVFIDKKGISHDGLLTELLNEFSLDDIKTGLQKVLAPKDLVYIVSKTNPGEDYLQETDTFDTWFSSGQWPLTTLKYPDGSDFKEFFPTDLMDSMWDILFFWIARMIMFSLYLTGEVPFKNVYIHGRIDDAQGRKMSKSLGNTVDPIEYVEKYGADALRAGIMVGSNTAARTTPLGETKVIGFRNFSNKIWNMARFTMLMVERHRAENGEIKFYDDANKLPGTSNLSNTNNLIDTNNLSEIDSQTLEKLKNLIEAVNKNLSKYRINNAGEDIQQFMWAYLADVYIEHVKNANNKDVALGVLIYSFNVCLKLLHPFMPFVTEAVWQEMKSANLLKDSDNVDLIVASWPQ